MFIINLERKQERSIAQNWRNELSCIHHINMIKCRLNVALNSVLTYPRCVGRIGEMNYFKTVRQSLHITVIIEMIAIEKN